MSRRVLAAALSGVVLASFVGGCGRPQPPGEGALHADGSSRECAEPFDPARDYFPEPAEIAEATLFRVSYHRSYKLLDVDAVGVPGGVARYLLVQCGAPLPPEHTDRTPITIPARRLAVTHSYLQEAIVLLDAVDRLVGVQKTDYAAAPEIRAAIEAGTVFPVGAGHHTDIELISALDPDAVLVYEPFHAESTRLIDLGVPVIPSSDGREVTMLGATEWMQVVAILLNREAEMNRILAETRARYRELAERVADVDGRPTFVVGRPYRGSWYLPGGRGNWAGLIEDAGAEYLLADDPSSESRPRSLEMVIDRGERVDVWIGISDAESVAELLADEPRLDALRAVEEGAVWANDGARDEDGYNPFWEHRLPYPDRMLADLIRVLHPDRLPEHELRYLRRLPAERSAGP